METETGEWILSGTGKNDPGRIRSVEGLEAFVNGAGFLPLFKNAVPGFSLEERTYAPDWWTDDPRTDPWEWRRIAAARGNIAYGKFFNGKAGFVSLGWLPDFCNFRRDGYDFEGFWEDEKATWRQKKVMDAISDGDPHFGPELKKHAGFGKNGEKNFEGTITELQMMTWIVIRDFKRRVNKQGLPYGWPVTVYATPESLWGESSVEPGPGRKPRDSAAAIMEQLKKAFPNGTENDFSRLMEL